MTARCRTCRVRRIPAPFPIDNVDNWTNTTTSKYYPDDCVWVISTQAFTALNGALASFFDGSTVNGTNGDPNLPYGDIWSLNLYCNATADFTSVDEFVRNLTISMTSVIRQNGDTPSSAYALGSAYGLQTCIGVQWAWLSLPAAVLGLAIIFLVATILQTAMRSPHATWKSSPLALLFHGISPETLERYGRLRETKEMEESANDIYVHFITDRP